MRITKERPEILSEWNQIFQTEKARGLKKSPIYKMIADTYNVSFTAVKYHLDPGYRAYKSRYAHERYRELSRRRNHRRSYRRWYNRNYRRFTRNPERYLTSMFEFSEQMSADEITARLRKQLEGIHFRTATIQGFMSRYITDGLGPPYLQEVEPGAYIKVNQTGL